jgi:hypothetical protein
LAGSESLGANPETDPCGAWFSREVGLGDGSIARWSSDRNAPRLVKCQAVLLSDPKIPQSKQPCHGALRLPEKEGKTLTKKLRRIVAGAARKSVHELLKQASKQGHAVVGAGLVVGSLVDPATLHNEHIRAHGREGQLFEPCWMRYRNKEFRARCFWRRPLT